MASASPDAGLTAGVQPLQAAPSRLERFGELWALLLDTHARTHGILFIFGLTTLASAILAFAPEGQDLLTSVAEDTHVNQAIWLAASLFWLALQAWFWARRIIEINFGQDRKKWDPNAYWLLVLTPRIIGAIPFALVIPTIALSRAMPWKPHTEASGGLGAWLVLGSAILAALYFAFVVLRQDFLGSMRARAERLSWTFPLFSLGLAIVSLAVILADPVSLPVEIGPAAVVFFGVACILPPMAGALQVGQLARAPLLALLIGLAALFSLWVDVRHEVGRRAPAFWAPVAARAPKRLPFEPAAVTWSLQAPSTTSSRVPMIVVASEGGASRAGYWTAVMLNQLQEQSGDQFSRSVLAISSISGGSVGAVGWVAALRTAPQTARQPLLSRFAGADALSPVLAGMLFPDLIQRFLPVPMLPDRAVALEEAWEKAWDDACSAVSCRNPNLMRSPFLDIWSPAGGSNAPAGWLPPVYIGGTDEESGARILTSPFTRPAKSASANMDASDFYDLDDRNIRASTAIHNGARFPWISPAGELRWAGRTLKGHVVDGGYFDASGAETARELLAAANFTLAGKAKAGPVQPILLSIRYQDTQAKTLDGPSCTLDARPDTPPPAKRFANDLRAPMVALLASREGHQQHLGSGQTSTSLAQIDVVLNGGGKQHGLPLNWVLSDPSMRYAEQGAEGCARKVLARIDAASGGAVH